MERLTVRQLSRETASVLDRVERGETIEVTRGKRVVAKVVPVQPQRERRAEWTAHLRWLDAIRSPGRRPRVDPVDELVAERRRRNARR
ncbi:MAG: type II toxin-antitoxin system prevent-host-death family antitoxin [Myxococcales bacterium]|nr:type II toxin-antitoxin system prevent-host-death family antitoxin [Myxococcales bacterium]